MLSKIVKFISFFIFFFFCLSLFQLPVLGTNSSFVTIVNPVRGNDFWSLVGQKPLDAVQAQKKLLEEYELPATWLLRPDIILDPEMLDYFKSFPEKHELGIFLEVTPTWTKKAGVKYHQGELWHYANSIFLSGYSLEERRRLIDSVFEEFKNELGFYPQSVGAWHVDARSLGYMKEKYGISATLICADQFSTDNYQIWGAWWGVPYYPSKYNVLIPAQSEKNKLDLVILQWAVRDPVNGYGGGVTESTFSVQANDYLKHGLDTGYFSGLVDIYTRLKETSFGQLTVGLENDFLWQALGEEYENQVKVLADKKISKTTMSEFSDWYRYQFPSLSPSYLMESKDLLGSEKQAIWLMSLSGRVGFLKQGDEIIIRDWRLYNDSWSEPNLETANPEINLTLSLPAQIDTIRFPQAAQLLTEAIKEENFFKEKLHLPFQTPRYIFWLTLLIFLIGLIVAYKINKILVLLIGLGSLILSLTMVRSGLLYPFGIGFWGPNGHDGVWHLALINQVLKGFPSPHPTFSGFKLTNYHYFYDLLLALVNKLTTIPIHHLYFQIFPVFMAMGLGILSFLVGFYWRKDFWTGFWLVFFNYFGGSFGYLVTWWRHRQLGGESLFWSMQAISTLINPPFALSLLVLLAGVLLLLKIKEWTLSRILGTAFLFGILINIKAYAGLVGLVALGVYALVKFIKNLPVGRQGERVYLGIFGLALLLSLVIFIPLNRGAGSLFVFQPFWFIHTMIESIDRFYWPRLAVARHFFTGKGIILGLVAVETIGGLIFLLGNLGTRIVGGWDFIRRIREKRLNDFDWFLSFGFLAGFVPVLLLVQKGTAWNVIQFFYYSLFFANFYAASTMARFIKNKKISQCLVLIAIVFLTMPTTFSTLKHYLGWPPPSAIPIGELEALLFLKSKKAGVVLTPYYDKFEKERYSDTPLPLKVYETAGYVAAFSGQQTFLEDEINLEISGYDWQDRRREMVEFFATEDSIWARGFLLNNKIGYLYLTQNKRPKVAEKDLGIEKIFDNGEVKIYEVRGII